MVDQGKPPPKDSGINLDQAPKPDAQLTIKEQEPNDGTPATAIHKVKHPVTITGSIGKVDDVDLFSLTVQPGERLRVTVTSSGSLLAHLALFDPAQKLPTAVNAGPGTGSMAEYYVLKAGTLLVGLRDRRNVGSTPQHVGGTNFKYTLAIQRLKRAPLATALGQTKSASLSPLGTVRVFAFTAQKDDNLRLEVKAQQLTPPSDMDARLSLFHPGQKAWLGTNDDAGSLKDSLLKGKMPFGGTYHAIVENVKLNPSKLNFSLKVAKQ